MMRNSSGNFIKEVKNEDWEATGKRDNKRR
jgi:hypothetical protein